jgi:hypothetical protein
MYIFTERGWRPLQVLVQPQPVAPPRYRGDLPSKELLAYCAALDRDHAEWVARRQVMKEQA